MMIMMNKKELISAYLDNLFPNPKCELNYNKDYELLIAVMLSAQTTDKKVNEVTKVLFNKYKTLDELKNANYNDILDIIHPLGTYNRKAKYLLEIANILVDKYNSVVPSKRSELESMPGVGRKVCNVFLSEWYHIDNIAVDTHVERVSKRFELAKSSDNVLEVEKKLKKVFPKSEWSKRHLQLVLFGRYYCKSIKPDCSNCWLKDICKK